MSDAQALGNDLREIRQNRRLTLEQVEKQLKIRARYLEALETGDYAALPSPVQARGFLRNYARFLGLDADLMVTRFDVALQGGSARRRRSIPKRTPQNGAEDPTLTSGGRQTISRRVDVQQSSAPTAPTAAPIERANNAWIGTALIGLTALLLLVLLVVLGGPFLQSIITQSRVADQPILSPLPNTVTFTPTATISPTPNAPTRLPIPNGAYTNTPTPSSGAVTLQITIEERTWLRVLVDGSIAYINAPAPGTVLRFQGNQIQVRAANAAGIHAYLNSNDLGILGQRGEILDRTFTINGVSLPTATQSSGVVPSTATPLPQVGAANLIAISPATSVPTHTFAPTRSATPAPGVSPSVTPLILPNETSTPDGGGSRPH
jgi:transcriptional regulator with XRE-family HTH domain